MSEANDRIKTLRIRGKAVSGLSVMQEPVEISMGYPAIAMEGERPRFVFDRAASGHVGNNGLALTGCSLICTGVSKAP
jgi:hypothetical protein